MPHTPENLGLGIYADEPVSVHTAAPGERVGGVVIPRGQAVVRAYEPSTREKIVAWLLGLDSEKPSLERRKLVEGLMGTPRSMGLVDLTPAGIPLAGNEARRDFNKGDYLGATMNAMALVPGARAGQPAVKAGRAALKPETFKASDGAIKQAWLKIARAKHAARKRARKGIIGYHGSPHEFSKFSTKQIGMGEGAQAYGHGLYFAGKEDVARQYRDQLASPMFKTPKGELFDPQSQLQHLNVRAAAHNNGIDLDATIKRAKELLRKASDQTRPMLEHDIAVLENFKAQGGVKKYSGHMYKIRIKADPRTMLDWDRPLSEQPKAVREAIIELAKDDRAKTKSLLPYHNPDLIAGKSDRMGESLYNYFLQGAYEPEIATRKLKEKGIPGIKYLDGMSRGAGKGTRNYVVFDDKIIDIIKKYGVAGLAALGAGGAAANLGMRSGNDDI